jgi:hypothetical protein
VALKSKIQVRNLIRRLIDDPAGKQWPTTDLDELIEGSLDELWGGELLDSFPWLTTAEDTPPLVVPNGAIDLTLLAQRFYRIQRVVRNSTIYQPAHPSSVVVANNVVLSAPELTYTQLGTTLWLSPFDTVTPAYVRYNYIPQPFTSLSPGPDPDDTADDDISFVPWPDGFHMVYIYDIAAKALERGDKEESAKLQKRAERSLFRLKAYLRKQHTGPLMVQLHDDAIGWGGV